MDLIAGKPELLEAFYYFANVAEHGGYAKAARALGVPKSRLSRHVSALEARLNVRLIQRSTRRFHITEVGQDVRRHALAMLAEAAAAVEAVEMARAEPRGIVRTSCPAALAQTALAGILPEFMQRYPAVRLLLHVSNRRVDVLTEGFDVALRVRDHPSGEDGLVMRTLKQLEVCLVASPAYLERAGRPRTPADVSEHTTLSFEPESERGRWTLSGPDGERATIEHFPRIVCPDFVVLRESVLAGLGIAFLPASVVSADLSAGTLERVLGDWRTPQGILHVVFPTRRGLLPAVRAWIDFLAERLPDRA
jgi:DNA-binding transcriptional LysR family regulator